MPVGSYPQARSEWCNFSRQFHVFTAEGVHFPAIFRVCVKKFYLSGQIIVDLWFKVNPEVFPWHICDFYSWKWGTKRNFSTTIFDIKWFVLLILSEIRDTVLEIIGLRTAYTKTKPLGVPMQELISFKVDILCQKL
jgi:hypothetical protein